MKIIAALFTYKTINMNYRDKKIPLKPKDTTGMITIKVIKDVNGKAYPKGTSTQILIKPENIEKYKYRQ